MSEETGFGIILASGFWLMVLWFSSIEQHRDAYRMGYAEGKLGLEQRYDPVPRKTQHD